MQNHAPRARPGKLRDVSNKLPQRKQREHRGLSQVSSILVNRFFVLFCFLKKIETVD